MKGAKTGGKQVGSKNKATVVKELLYNNMWDEVAGKITSEGIQKCWLELDSLNGKDYVTAFMGLLEYFKPKLQRNTHIGDPTAPIASNVSLSHLSFDELMKLKYGDNPTDRQGSSEAIS